MITTPETTIHWRPEYVGRFATASTAADAIRLVGAMLIAHGAVTSDHVQAAVRREAEFPTGIPAEVPFALVHTDAPGALRLAAALGCFDTPVEFRRMDAPDEILPVQLVVMLAVPHREAQADVLSALVSAFADSGFTRQLLATDAVHAARLLAQRLT
jgi:galactitol PTS system EIIA component